MSSESDVVALREVLSRLPEESPPPTLWLRIEVEHARRFPARRAPRWRPALAAVAAALLLLSVLPWLRQPHSANDVPAPWAADAPAGSGKPRSATPPPGVRPEQLPAAAVAALRSLDRELQRRYLEGASDAELAPLWRRREELQQQPDAANPATQPIRI